MKTVTSADWRFRLTRLAAGLAFALAASPVMARAVPSETDAAEESGSAEDLAKKLANPVNAMVTKVLKLVSVGGGARYYVAGPDIAPDWTLARHRDVPVPQVMPQGITRTAVERPGTNLDWAARSYVEALTEVVRFTSSGQPGGLN